jgi:hypothetical protein
VVHTSQCQSRNALGLRGTGPVQLFELSAALAGVSSCLTSARAVTLHQSKVAGLYPVASCSSPRVVRRTSVRIRCLPFDDIIDRHYPER